MNSRFFSSITRFLLCACLFLLLPAHAKRLALVIGNDNYTAVSKLQKAGNDASAMARELRAAGFEVQLHKDLNYRGMVKAIEGFAKGISGGDEVVVFFAGHGVQIKNGSYLLPTDIEAASEKAVEKMAYELLALTDLISEAKPAFTLFVIDACRNNPIKTNGRSVGNSRGLSAIEPPKGQMVVYSASRGQEALDRLGEKDPNPNGVFTREFIARMKRPGAKIEDIMRDVQDAVESLAKTINHEQRPAIYNEARGNFYFFGPTTVQTATSPVQVMSEEQKDEKFWEDVKSVNNKESYDAYLRRFPSGIYANLAKANISKLSEIIKSPTSQLSIAPISNTTTKQLGDSETQQLYYLATTINDPDSQLSLGVRYEKGTGGLVKDDIEAVKYYRLSADQGHVRGQSNLGFFYSTGRGGLVKNDVEALKLFRLSADQGGAHGQAHLGIFYSTGRGGLVKDDVQAAWYFRMSANQRNSLGQAFLGIFYSTGRGGLVKDDVEAEKYFRLSANQGSSTGQAYLGILYNDGRGGLVKDDIQALKLFRLSADQGNAVGQAFLGIYYSNGRGGLVKDDIEAEKYFRLSANQGSATGQVNLGIYYNTGRGGLIKNEAEAIRLFKLAVKQDNNLAKDQLKKLGISW